MRCADLLLQVLLTSRSSRHTKTAAGPHARSLMRRSSCSGSNVLHCFGRSSCAAPSAATLMHRFGQSSCGGSKMRSTASPPKCCWILMRRSSSQILSATLLWPALMRCSKCCWSSLRRSKCQTDQMCSSCAASAHATAQKVPAAPSCAEPRAADPHAPHCFGGTRAANTRCATSSRSTKCRPHARGRRYGHLLLSRIKFRPILKHRTKPSAPPTARPSAAGASCVALLRSALIRCTKCCWVPQVPATPCFVGRSSRAAPSAAPKTCRTSASGSKCAPPLRPALMRHPRAAPKTRRDPVLLCFGRSSCGGSNALHCLGRSSCAAPSAAGSSHANLMRRINALLCVLRGPASLRAAPSAAALLQPVLMRRNQSASRPSCSGPMRSSASADTKCGGAKRADRMPGAMASNRSSRLFRARTKCCRPSVVRSSAARSSSAAPSGARASAPPLSRSKNAAGASRKCCWVLPHARSSCTTPFGRSSCAAPSATLQKIVGNTRCSALASPHAPPQVPADPHALLAHAPHQVLLHLHAAPTASRSSCAAPSCADPHAADQMRSTASAGYTKCQPIKVALHQTSRASLSCTQCCQNIRCRSASAGPHALHQSATRSKCCRSIVCCIKPAELPPRCTKCCRSASAGPHPKHHALHCFGRSSCAAPSAAASSRCSKYSSRSAVLPDMRCSALAGPYALLQVLPDPHSHAIATGSKKCCSILMPAGQKCCWKTRAAPLRLVFTPRTKCCCNQSASRSSCAEPSAAGSKMRLLRPVLMRYTKVPADQKVLPEHRALHQTSTKCAALLQVERIQVLPQLRPRQNC